MAIATGSGDISRKAHWYCDCTIQVSTREAGLGNAEKGDSDVTPTLLLVLRLEYVHSILIQSQKNAVQSQSRKKQTGEKNEAG